MLAGPLLVTANAELVTVFGRICGRLALGRVTTADTTSSAFAQMQVELPSVLILDSELPDGGALSLRRRVEGKEALCATVLIAPSDADEEQLSLFDCDLIATRPIDETSLERRLLQLLRSSPEGRGRTPEASQPDPIDSTPIPAMTPGRDARGDAPALGGADSAPVVFDPRTAGFDGLKQPLKTALHGQGNLALTPFPALLYKLFANRLSGMLDLGNGSVEVVFESGMPTDARRRNHHDALVRRLVASGKMAPEMEGKANDATIHRLIVLGSLTEDDLAQARVAETLAVLLDVFSWQDSPFTFTIWEGHKPTRGHRLNPIALIAEGIPRTVAANETAMSLSAHLGAYPVRTEKWEAFLQYYPASALEWDWIRLIDGTRTLQDLSAVAKGRVLDLLSLVYVLDAADIIAFSETPRTTSVRPPEKPVPTVSTGSRAAPVGQPTRPQKASPSPPVPEPVAGTLPASQPARPQAASPRPPPPEPVAGILPVEEALSDYLRRLESGDDCYLLDVPAKPTAEDVRTAYRRYRERMPPDQVERLASGAKRNAQKVEAAIKGAYQRILTDRMREAFGKREKAREVGPPKATSTLVDDLRQKMVIGKLRLAKVRETAKEEPKSGRKDRYGYAEMEYQAAYRLALRGKWEQAGGHIQAAVRQAGRRPSIMALQAWIAFNLKTDDRQRQVNTANEQLEVARMLDDTLADTWFYLGYVREAKGLLSEASDCFQRAIELGDDDLKRRAKRQLDSLRGRLAKVKR